MGVQSIVVMSLLDKQEIEPKVVNVMLLDNQECSQENDEVLIEEIHEENSSEELRKRRASNESCVY